MLLLCSALLLYSALLLRAAALCCCAATLRRFVLLLCASLSRERGRTLVGDRGSLRRGEFKMMKQLQSQFSEELAQRMASRRSSIVGDESYRSLGP